MLTKVWAAIVVFVTIIKTGITTNKPKLFKQYELIIFKYIFMCIRMVRWSVIWQSFMNVLFSYWRNKKLYQPSMIASFIYIMIMMCAISHSCKPFCQPAIRFTILQQCECHRKCFFICETWLWMRQMKEKWLLIVEMIFFSANSLGDAYIYCFFFGHGRNNIDINQ